MTFKNVCRVSAFICCACTILWISGCNESGQLRPEKFFLPDPIVVEGNANEITAVTVRADQPVPAGAIVNYSLQEGGARFGVDLVESSGVLDFNGGTDALIPIEIMGDSFPELSESLGVVVTFEEKEFILELTVKDNDELEPIMTDGEGYLSGSHPSMQLVWADEFEGAQLNEQDWSYELGNGCEVGICGWGNNELQKYTRESANVNVANGKLTVTALETLGSYSSGRIKTQQKRMFTFGRIDVRAKLPKGQGIWPAIWMLGESITTTAWPRCGEIDIMELVGHQPNVVHGTVHYDSDGYKSSSTSRSLATGDFSEQFHVFTLVWDRDRIQWFVDNVEFKKFERPSSGSYPFNAPFFLIFNVAVGGNWPGKPDSSTSFPQSMVVDYVRVFQ